MVSSILIADDHELFRKSLIKVLHDYFPKADFMEGSTGDEVIEKAKNHRPDIILLDIEMPDLNGIKTLIELRKQNIESKILLLTAKIAKEFIYITKKYGANGYFTKNISPELLAESIQRILSSNLFICSEWFSLEFNRNDQFAKKIISQVETLTKREREVLQHFFNGLNTEEVSIVMNVRKKSVDNYKNRILTKMETPSYTYFNDWVNKNREVIRFLI